MSDYMELIARAERAWASPRASVAVTANLVPELVSALKEAHRRIDLMRDLHRPTAVSRGTEGSILRCRECRHDWLCDTSWKLDGLDGPDGGDL
ncbi:hypothetical protein [Mycolicibacterium setense]